MKQVVIIDYGTGNVSSIGRMLSDLAVPWSVSASPDDVASASHLILPGVGHGAHAMSVLEASGLVHALEEAVHGRKLPVLGICLGMQLMTSHTEEGGRRCLGWFGQETTEIRPGDTRLKVPNIGWHAVSPMPGAQILQGIDLGHEPFYFCHRFGVPVADGSDLGAVLEYGQPYAAVLQRDNMVGVQFHPEKSQEPGVRLFSNFLAMEGRNV